MRSSSLLPSLATGLGLLLAGGAPLRSHAAPSASTGQVRILTPTGCGEEQPVTECQYSGRIAVRARLTAPSQHPVTGADLLADGNPVATWTPSGDNPTSAHFSWSAKGSDPGSTLHKLVVRGHFANAPDATAQVRVSMKNVRSGQGLKRLPPGELLGLGPDVRHPLTDVQQRNPDGSFERYPWMQGFAVIDTWANLQHDSPASLDVSYLKDALTDASPGHPAVFIIKIGSNGTPAWVTDGTVLDRPQPAEIRNPLRPQEPGVPTIAAWDPVVLDFTQNLLARLAATFDDAPGLAGIYLTGPTSAYPEMTFSTAPSPQALDPKKVWSVPYPSRLGDESVPPFTVTTYADDWNGRLDDMLTQFRRTAVIGMLDATPEKPYLYGNPPASNSSTVGLKVAQHFDAAARRGKGVLVGTANLGPWPDDGPDDSSGPRLNEFPYSQMRASKRAAPIFYELGPRKSVQGTEKPDDRSTHFHKGLENCTTLGCHSVVVWTANLEDTPGNKPTYVPDSPHLAECASYDVFHIPAEAPPDCPPRAGRAEAAPSGERPSRGIAANGPEKHGP